MFYDFSFKLNLQYIPYEDTHLGKIISMYPLFQKIDRLIYIPSDITQWKILFQKNVLNKELIGAISVYSTILVRINAQMFKIFCNFF